MCKVDNLSVFQLTLLLLLGLLTTRAFGSLLELNLSDERKHLREIKFETHSLRMKVVMTTPSMEKEHVLRIRCPQGYKMIAYLKSANLRVDWTATTDSHGRKDDYVRCIDYITFKHDDMRSRICHTVGENDTRSDSSHSTGRGSRILQSTTEYSVRQFSSTPPDSLELLIHTEPYLPSSEVTSTIILAQLVFTAYSACTIDHHGHLSSNQFSCSKSHRQYCISRSLLCDGEINCVHSEGFGSDEDGCTVIKRDVSILTLSDDDSWDNVVHMEDARGAFEKTIYYGGLATTSFFFLLLGSCALVMKYLRREREEKTAPGAENPELKEVLAVK